MTYRLEYAKIYRVKKGCFDIECIAQYAQNSREGLHNMFINTGHVMGNSRPGFLFDHGALFAYIEGKVAWFLSRY